MLVEKNNVLAIIVLALNIFLSRAVLLGSKDHGYVVTNFYGYEADTTCDADIPLARYFGKLDYCTYNSGEYRRRRDRALATKSASGEVKKSKSADIKKSKNAKSSKMKAELQRKVAKHSMFDFSAMSESSRQYGDPNRAKKVEAAKKALAEKQKQSPAATLKDYWFLSEKRTMSASPVGKDAVLVTRTAYFVDGSDTEPFMCDIDHFYYWDSQLFPLDQCFDYRDPDGQYDYGNYVGFAKISLSGGISFPAADGLTVSLFTKDNAGLESCKGGMLDNGASYALRPAFGIAWYPTGVCTGYSPFTDALDDDNYKVSSVKYTCNDDGTFTVDFWEGSSDDGVGTLTCDGQPTDSWTFPTGSKGCEYGMSDDDDVKRMIDDDDEPIDKIYPGGDFDESAAMRIDCVKSKAKPKAKLDKHLRA